ncbi:hypothetical protein GQ607_001437 [Colletotrichum asianum]|uniref:Rhodopsin domain-containing protein n=1 Tax=Colletotrichum asianum TaxID=702518 RepID=A0A8H3WQG3_9PEZI|nr:hypothetical protein GQ607_001437 [Colletotrichum asianum]
MLIWNGTGPVKDMEANSTDDASSAASWEGTLPPGSLNSRSDTILAIGIVMTVVATVFVALRVYVRAFLIRKWGADDTLLASAFIAVVLHNSMLCVATRFGLGKHVWMNTIKNLIKGQKISLFVIIMYQVAFVTIKIAFLFQYRRVFPYSKVELLCNIGICFLALFGIQLLVCAGVSFDLIYRYTFFDTPINVMSWWMANASIHLITNVLIFIIPIPFLGRLQMTRTQKLALIASFALGLLTCAISIIRIATIPKSYLSMDQTYHQTPTIIWSITELSIAIICCCIPTLRPLSHPSHYSANTTGPRESFMNPFPPPSGAGAPRISTANTADRGSSSISGESDVVVIRKPRSSFWHRSRKQSDNSTLNGDVDEIEPVPVLATVMRTPTIPVTLVTTDPSSPARVEMPVLEINGLRRPSEATVSSGGGGGIPRRTRSMRSSIVSDGSLGGFGRGLGRNLSLRRHMSVALTERDSDDDVYYFGVSEEEVDLECPTPLSPPPKSRQSLSESR